MQSFIEALTRRGCHVERCDSAVDYAEAWRISGICLSAVNTVFQSLPTPWVRRAVSPLLQRFGPRHPLTRGLFAGPTLDRACLRRALEQRLRLIQQLEKFLGAWDCWICPAFPTPAFTHRAARAPIEVDGQSMSQLEASLHTIIFNMTGHPVVTDADRLVTGGSANRCAGYRKPLAGNGPFECCAPGCIGHKRIPASTRVLMPVSTDACFLQSSPRRPTEYATSMKGFLTRKHDLPACIATRQPKLFEETRTNRPSFGAASLLRMKAAHSCQKRTVNVLGNCLATEVVSRWKGDFGKEQPSPVVMKAVAG